MPLNGAIQEVPIHVRKAHERRGLERRNAIFVVANHHTGILPHGNHIGYTLLVIPYSAIRVQTPPRIVDGDVVRQCG